MRKLRMRQVDIGVGAVVVAFAIFVLTQSLQLDFYNEGVPGPGFFPSLLAVALAVTGGLLSLTSVLGNKDGGEEFHMPSRGQATRSLSVWLAVAGAVLLVSVAGFILAMLALAVVLVLGLEAKRNLAGIAVVILIPLLTYLLFSVLLSVQLPTGVFGI